MPALVHTVLPLLAAYLLGSLSGSLLLGRLRGIDVRRHGSGNAGGTNALRVLGWRYALGVVTIDIGKGALAAWLGLRLLPDPAWAWWAAALAVVGHVWPVWHGFRGGKGAATVVGGLLVLWPTAVAALLVVWLAVLVSSGYVGLATVGAALALPLLAWALAAPPPALAYAGFVALFVAWTHRANLRRLRAGSEPRFVRVWLLRRWWGRAP
jgi:glycerol-3-phosphate acyltransferase PlsY